MTTGALGLIIRRAFKFQQSSFIHFISRRAFK